MSFKSSHKGSVYFCAPETPVEIVRPPQDMFEPPGSDIVFEVELNKDRVEVKWMRNNMIIVQGDKYQMISEGKIHRLQVCEIRPRDQGEYRIVAKDKDARAKLELAGELRGRHHTVLTGERHMIEHMACSMKNTKKGFISWIQMLDLQHPLKNILKHHTFGLQFGQTAEVQCEKKNKTSPNEFFHILCSCSKDQNYRPESGNRCG